MYKEITTVEAALAAHKDSIELSKIDFGNLPSRFSKGAIALMTLEAITEIINNDDPNVADWEPNYDDEDQEKWFPWYIGGSSGFQFNNVNYTNWNTNNGSEAQQLQKVFDTAQTLPLGKK